MEDDIVVEGQAADEVSPEVTPSGAKRFIVLAGVLALVVGAIAVGLSSSSSSANAASIVRAALVSSVGDKTVAFTLDEQISGAVSIDVTGNGACDFSSGDCNMTMNYGGQFASLGQATAIFANGTAYISFSGALGAQMPTQWVSLPLNVKSINQSSALGSSENPLSGLAELAQKGDQVTDDGLVNVGGTSLHEYTVAVSASAAQGQVSTALKNLPSWLSQTASTSSLGGATMQVYIDNAGQLARIVAHVSASSAGTSLGVVETEVMTGYGAPVSVTVPSSDQVTPVANLLNGLT
jgi:hypothetical protein